MFEYVPPAERQSRKGAQLDGARECSPTPTVPTWNHEVVHHKYGIYRDIPMLRHLRGSCSSIWQRPVDPGATKLGVQSVPSRAMSMEGGVGKGNSGMVSLCP